MMEAQLIVAAIVQRCELTLIADAQPALEPLITLRPKGGLPMRVRYATCASGSNSVTQLRPSSLDR
jgi:cytochrome P450